MNRAKRQRKRNEAIYRLISFGNMLLNDLSSQGKLRLFLTACGEVLQYEGYGTLKQTIRKHPAGYLGSQKLFDFVYERNRNEHIQPQATPASRTTGRKHRSKEHTKSRTQRRVAQSK